MTEAPGAHLEHGLADRRVPHVLVDDVASPALADDDAHHLVRVLRLRPGASLTIGDGRGSWRDARLSSAAPAPAIEPTGEIAVEGPAAGVVHVGFSLVKGARPELVVQKLTELGVDRISPFVSERSVVQWEEARGERNHQRLVKVARSAVMQSRRAWMPTIDRLCRFGDLVAPGVAIADRGGEPLPWPCGPVLVGPEGGWAETERERSLGVFGLGPTTLRAETAAIAVGVLLTAMRANHARPVA